MTEDWLTALVGAQEREQQHTEPSESAAAGLLAWCLNGPVGSGGAGGDNTFHLKCIRCGTPIQYVPPTADSGGDYLSHLWACPDCKDVLRGIFGTPGSPGRPELPARDTRVRRLRGLSHRVSALRSQQPAPPRMLRVSEPRPGGGAPVMPRPGP